MADLNGSKTHDIVVHDERFYGRVLAGGSLALGETYMDGWWDAADLAEFFNRVLRARVADKLRVTPNLVWQIQHNFISLQHLSSIHAHDVQIGDSVHLAEGGGDAFLLQDANGGFRCGHQGHGLPPLPACCMGMPLFAGQGCRLSHRESIKMEMYSFIWINVSGAVSWLDIKGTFNEK